MGRYRLSFGIKYFILYVCIPLAILSLCFLVDEGYKPAIIAFILYLLIIANCDSRKLNEKAYAAQREAIIKKAVKSCDKYKIIRHELEGPEYSYITNNSRLSCDSRRFFSDNFLEASYKDISFTLSHIRGFEVERLGRNSGFYIPCFKGMFYVFPYRNNYGKMVFDSHNGKVGIVCNGLSSFKEYKGMLPARSCVWAKDQSDISDDLLRRCISFSQKVDGHTMVFVSKDSIAVFLSDKKNLLRGSLFVSEKDISEEKSLVELDLPSLFIDSVFEPAKVSAPAPAIVTNPSIPVQTAVKETSSEKNTFDMSKDPEDKFIVLDYEEAEFDFKKACQDNIKQNFKPLLKQHGFTEYRRNHFAREKAMLMQLITFSPGKYEMKIHCYYVPLFSGTDNVIYAGRRITDGYNIFCGTNDSQAHSKYHDVCIERIRHNYLYILNTVIPEMDSINSIHDFASLAKFKKTKYFGAEAFHLEEPFNTYKLLIGVTECMNGDFDKGTALLKGINRFDNDPEYRYLDQLICDNRIDFMKNLSEVVAERRKYYKVIK